jgi:hypothetical protein
MIKPDIFNLIVWMHNVSCRGPSQFLEPSLVPPACADVQGRAEVQLTTDTLRLVDVQQAILWVLGETVSPRFMFVQVLTPPCSRTYDS